MKYIYWFADYNLKSPCVRYRAYYPLRHLLATRGINHRLVLPGYRPDRILLFLKTYVSALFFQKPESIIIIQKVRSNFIYANLLKLLVLAKPEQVIYDIDDADYLEHNPRTIYFFSKRSWAISAGSYALKDKFLSLNENVFVNSTPVVDMNIEKEKKSPTFTIGWVGFYGGDHKEALETFCFPALKNLPFSFTLILMGVRKKTERKYLRNYFKPFGNISLEIPQHIPWENELAIQNSIKSFDVGIATLLDNELHRSKSAFKTKQYLNNGVPVLSPNFAENNRFIEDGVNGYLCNTSQEFHARINEIYQMGVAEYYELSKRARLSVKNFNQDFYCEKLLIDLRNKEEAESP